MIPTLRRAQACETANYRYCSHHAMIFWLLQVQAVACAEGVQTRDEHGSGRVEIFEMQYVNCVVFDQNCNVKVTTLH